MQWSSVDELQDSIADVANIVRASATYVADKVRQVVDDNRSLQKDIEALKSKLANASGTDLMSGLKEINGVSVLSTVVEGADAKSLRGVADQVRSKLESGVFFLAAVDGDKAALVAGVTSNLTDKSQGWRPAQVCYSSGGWQRRWSTGYGSGCCWQIQRICLLAMESVYSWVEDKSEALTLTELLFNQRLSI